MRALLFSLILVSQAFAAIVGTPRGTASNGGTFGSTVTLTLTATPTLGNLIVVGVGLSTVDSAPTMVDNFANNYPRLGCQVTTRGFCFFSLLVPAGISGTYTVTITRSSGTSDISLGAIEYTGAASASFFDAATQGSTGADGSEICTGITTGSANEMVVVGLYSLRSATSITSGPAGYTVELTLASSAVRVFGVADKINATASATGNLTWTLGAGTAGTWGCFVAAIKPGGATTPIKHRVISQ